MVIGTLGGCCQLDQPLCWRRTRRSERVFTDELVQILVAIRQDTPHSCSRLGLLLLLLAPMTLAGCEFHLRPQNNVCTGTPVGDQLYLWLLPMFAAEQACRKQVCIFCPRMSSRSTSSPDCPVRHCPVLQFQSPRPSDRGVTFGNNWSTGLSWISCYSAVPLHIVTWCEMTRKLLSKPSRCRQ